MCKMKWLFVMMVLMLALLPGSTGRTLANGSDISPTPPLPSKEEIVALKYLLHGDNLPPLLKHGLSAPRTQARQPATLPGIYSWSKIAFQRYFDNNYEVFVAMGDGNSPQRLTFDPANDGRARLNRGADKVVFSSNRDGDFEIYSINVDGSNLRQLTYNANTDARPAWSPDGKKIAYASDETGHAEIYTMNADGSGKTQLTSSGGLDCLDPSWSPDGTRLAYVTWDADGYGYLWTVPAAGGAPSNPTPNRMLFPGDPAWSPDGSMIAFDQADQYSYFNTSIYFLHLANGYTEVRLIDNQVTYEDHYLGGWAPDGNELIFNRIQYMVVDNNLYISNAFIDTRCFDTGAGCKRNEIRIQGDGTDFLPDWQSADIEPPNSQILPLSAYSRADGFPLRWIVQTSGLAQLTGFNIQLRQNQSQWWDWYLSQNPTLSEYISGFSPGDVLNFRLQAYDEAGNQEAWTSYPNGDAQTTLYTFDLKGRVADLRDRPVPAAALAIDPAAASTLGVDADGSYHAFLLTREAYTITAQAAGYGKPFDTTRNPRSDMQQDLHFPPLNDLIKNGGFENQAMQDWQVSIPISSTDHLTATRQAEYRASGASALTLGSACQEPCFSPPENFYPPVAQIMKSGEAPTSQENWAVIAVQGDGTIQLLAWELDGLKAFQRSTQGVWSAPITLDTNFASSAVPTYLKLSPSGGAIAVWLSPESGIYRMATKPPAGGWGSPGNLPVPIETYKLKDVAMDSNGGLFLLYLKGDIQTGYDLYFSYRTPAGAWQTPKIAFDNDLYSGSINQAALAVTPDHFLHVFWASSESTGNNLMYRRLNPSGEVIENTALVRRGMVGLAPMIALEDELGQVHLIYPEYQVTHLMRYANGSWSAREALPNDLGWLNSAAAYRGSLYLTGSSGNLRYTPGQGWSMNTLPSGSSSLVTTFDANGLLYAADEINYWTQARAAENGSISIQQRLTIPSSLHKPTLSFQAQLRGPQGLKNSYFEATLTQGITSTQVFSNNIPSGWTHHWLALDDWAGKQITVTFTLHQGAGDPLVYLDLDNISLGAWETPVLDSVAPAVLPEPAGRVITITGQNFIQKPQVRIGQTIVPVANVTWSNEKTLLVTLPTGLSLGDQDLRVTNPGGQVAILPGSLRLGHLVLVPLLER
jgi:dipeptidyl aminopeptidase/acylaminoacyl peptidase